MENTRNKKVNLLALALLIALAIILLLILVLNNASILKGTNSQTGRIIENKKTAKADSFSMGLYKTYLTKNNFEGPKIASGVNVVNGILAGYDTNSIDLLAINGSINFKIDLFSTAFFTQSLVPDPSNAQNKIFSKSAPYSFADFTNSVPLGTVVQVVYTSDTQGNSKVKEVNTYIDQKAL